jgi:hypothetical protein
VSISVAANPDLRTSSPAAEDPAGRPDAAPRWLSTALVALIALPALFVFFAIQHSALTVPFYDHIEFGRMLVRFHDGQFHWSELWSGHNHGRPLTLRVICLVNALLTDWDLRSEYAYVYMAIYGAFAALAWALWRATRGVATATRLALLAVLSLLAFSPVGHNNHWWSFMLQLDLAHLFIVCTLIAVAFRPRSLGANALAAASCWLATYTLTNGLVAFVIAAATAQVAQARRLAMGPISWFWLANLVVVFPTYLIGLPETGSTVRPSLVQMVVFALAYLGAPLASLAHFPYVENFHLPKGPTPTNAAYGALLAMAWLALSWNQRHKLRPGDAGALLLVALGGFAMGSAVLTAWARAAFDAYGVHNANGSRFTIFSSYLLLAILFGTAGILAERARGTPPAPARPAWNAVGWVAFAAFVLVAGNTYRRSVRVYRTAHQFNIGITAEYFAPQEGSHFQFLYPRPEVPRQLMADLRRLKLGPYRGSP